MADFLVDESKFLLINEEERGSFFNEGFILPDGMVIGAMLEDSENWQIYVSEDDDFHILAVKDSLAEKWFAAGFLTSSQMMAVENGGAKFFILMSPVALKLSHISGVHCKKSCRYALNLASAFQHTRMINSEVNLRDAIYTEQYSLLLPTYTQIPEIADRALYLNALRNEKQQAENLSDSEAMTGFVSLVWVKKVLREKQYAELNYENWLGIGDAAGDFLGQPSNCAQITGLLIASQHFQLFDTDTQKYLLIIDELWADALLQSSLVTHFTLTPLPIDGRKYYALPLSKKYAVETLNDRVHGLTERNTTLLARAIRTSRAQAPSADFKDALYLEEKMVVLPLSFCSEEHDDLQLLASVLREGPYALSPFMDDVNADLLEIVRH